MIRVATTDDFEIAKKLTSELSKETIYASLFKNFELTPEILGYYTTDPKERLSILSIDNETNEVIGFAVFDKIKPWHHLNGILARISMIYIKPEYRGKGYGKEINQAFEYWGRKIGANALAIGKTQIVDNAPDSYTKIEELFIKDIN